MDIVKGYWKCKYCSSKDLDGLIDICPNCGKQKSEDVKYYLTDKIEYVSERELNDAGIDISECDGNHKEWICGYCSQLNNYADNICVACGASKVESEREYGDIAIEESPRDVSVMSTTNISYETHNELLGRKSTNSLFSKGLQFLKSHMLLISTVLSILLVTILCVFLFYPIETMVEIEEFSWKRTITIEEERTVKESGWHVPAGGRVYDTRKEFKEYKRVLDHYETVHETKTRRVFSHYETTYTYKDNGNGTFEKVAHQEPVYKTETYVETKQEPVYRQDPVYANKYYYEIERWFKVDTYTTEAQNKLPYWASNYVLGENERDNLRTENYYVLYDNDTQENLPYNEWLSYSIGDGFVITKNRLGIIYKKEQIMN